MVENVELAWLAGFVDGDGSIGLKRSKSIKSKGGIRYSPLIQITNCDMKLIAEVRFLLGKLNIRHSYWLRDMKKRNLKWRNAGNISIYTWIDSILFLEFILPYLVGKKEQAEVLIEFCKTRIGGRRHNNFGKFISTQTGKEKYYWEKLHQLNHKGKR